MFPQQAKCVTWATDTHATVEELLAMVFSVWLENNCAGEGQQQLGVSHI
jgi:hypothetical protein